jgi:hypothetical protein
MHDNYGSKLDSHLCIGHWVGFDKVSDRHQVYWPDKLTVSVEHSIKFDNDWVMVP